MSCLNTYESMIHTVISIYKMQKILQLKDICSRKKANSCTDTKISGTG